MRVSRETVAVAALLLAAPAASAATVSGSAALAIAALVARHAPRLGRYDKRLMALMLDDRLDFSAAPGRTISVAADTVACRTSNVDIALHSCDLGFGTTTVALTGREAQELFATLAEAGVKPEGAAGSISENLTHLACTIDPNAVKKRAGAGAECRLDAAAS